MWGHDASENKRQYTEDRGTLKQKETHLNDCERLKAPKQFTFSGKGFPTSNSLSLLSRANVHRGKKKKKKNRKIEIKLIHTVQIMAPIASWNLSEEWKHRQDLFL